MNPNPSPSTRFQPGNRANLNGRPKGRSLAGRLRDALERESATDPGETTADRLVSVLVRIALEGDRQAIKDVFDRVDGKVPDRLEIDSDQDDETIDPEAAACALKALHEYWDARDAAAASDRDDHDA